MNNSTYPIVAEALEMKVNDVSADSIEEILGMRHKDKNSLIPA